MRKNAMSPFTSETSKFSITQNFKFGDKDCKQMMLLNAKNRKNTHLARNSGNINDFFNISPICRNKKLQLEKTKSHKSILTWHSERSYVEQK